MSPTEGLLLAAGESSRLGRPKPLLAWAGMPLIQYQVSSLVAAGTSEIIVVLGHQADLVAPFVRSVNSIKMVINTDYAKGKTGSIKRGLKEISPQAQAIIVMAVDQPRPPEVLKRLLEAHLMQGRPISLPLCKGRRGHPLLFSRSLLPELLNITEERKGLREVVEKDSRRVNEVPFEAELVLLDINTEDEYRRGLTLFGVSS